MDREKFLVPKDLTFGQLLFVLRRRLHIEAGQSLFLYSKQRVLGGQTPVIDVYHRDHDPEDGFLYVQYTMESTFGA